MRETQEFEVETSKGPAVVTLTQLDGVKGTRLFVRLTKLLAPAAKALAAAKAEGTAMDRGIAALGGVLAEVDPDMFESVMREVLTGAVARFTEVDDVDDAVAKHVGDLFAGHAVSLVKLVGEAILFNFPDVRGLLMGTKASP